MPGRNPLGILDGIIQVEKYIGDFVKGDIGGNSPIANHFRDGYQARCEELSNAPGWFQGLVNAGAGSALGRICQPYLDDNDWDSPVLEPPFEGGQCPIRYTVSILTSTSGPSSSGNPIPASTTNTPRPLGPISGPYIGPATGLTPGSANCGAGGLGAGVMTAEGPYVISCFPNPAQISPEGVAITGITPFSGSQSDDCGDPDPVPVPGPNPAPMPNPDRLPDDDPTPIPDCPNCLPDIPVIPFDDPIFGPSFPGLPDGYGFGGGSSGGGGAGRPTDPIANDDGTGGGDEDFPEEPSGQVYVGAYLELTEVPSNITNVPGTGPENAAYYRIVGNFSLYSDATGERLRSDSLQVRNQWTKFIGNPQGLPISGARVKVLPGVRYRVIPVVAPADTNDNGENGNG